MAHFEITEDKVMYSVSVKTRYFEIQRREISAYRKLTKQKSGF